MRIERLLIRGFGPLRDVDRDFSGGDEGLHVVYGPNESGKSLSLKALEHGLFPMAGKIDGFSDQDLQQIDVQLAISRRLPDGTRERLEFRRLRARPTQLDGVTPLDESRIVPFLGTASLEIFRRAYGLSSERIREGGRLLLESKGDIAAALFAAATGLERVRAVEKDLETRHARLFSPSRNATIPRLNEALQSFRRSFGEYSAALQLPDATDDLEARLAGCLREIATVDATLEQLSRRRAHLALVRAARAAAGELNAATIRLAELGDQRPLSAGFRTRLDAARTAIAGTTALVNQHTAAIADLRRRRDALAVDERQFAGADDIKSLLRATDELSGFDQSIPRRRDEIACLTEENARTFAAIEATTGASLREAAILCPSTHADIQDLITAHGGLHSAHEERRRQVDDHRRRLDELGRELALLDEVGDDRDVAARLAEIRDAGDLEAQLAARRDSLAADAEDHAAACRRLDGLPAGLPVENLRVPSTAEVQEYRERFRVLDADSIEIRKEAKVAADTIASLERRIALLEEAAALPPEGELERLRADRDAALAAAGAEAGRGTLSGPAAAERFATLAEIVAAADRTVDRLRAHADKATQRTQHREEIARQRERLERAERDGREIAARRARAEEDWAALWRDAGVAPGAPVAMEAWLATHADCCQRAAALRAHRREAAALEERVAAERAALAALLAELGGTAPPQASRRQLLTIVGRALEDRRAKAIARQQKARQIASEQENLVRAQTLLDAARADVAGWQDRWAACMGVLDQPDTVTTSAGRFLLDSMRGVATRQQSIAEQRARVAAMESRRDEILAVMRRVCDLVGRSYDPAAIVDLGRVADDRLRAAERAREQRDTLNAEIGRHTAELADVRRRRDEAEAVVAALRAEAGVEAAGDDRLLDEAWDRFVRRREVQAEVDGWRQKFLVAAAGADPEALLEECLATGVEQLAEQANAIDEEVAGLHPVRDRLRDERTRLEAQVDALGSDRSARAWADCRMHEAAVLDRLGEYLPLRLATLALTRAARRYRDEHQAPVLGRASTLFARITGGGYSDIRLAEKDIYAVRGAGPSRSVFQRQMSEGTNDQMYLALRLAALEHGHEQQVDGRAVEPLPLILDDGLVHFDDDRTRAMLEVLADVATRMQVIVFTHHRGVVDIARALRAARPGAVFIEGAAG
jgi:uncharacterized protein YhaN